jgi:hypothetical protein
LAKPLYEITKGRGWENENPWCGERSKKRPLKKVRGYSQMPLLWACKM